MALPKVDFVFAKGDEMPFKQVRMIGQNESKE
jgi:hypothetical protein